MTKQNLMETKAQYASMSCNFLFFHFFLTCFYLLFSCFFFSYYIFFLLRFGFGFCTPQ